MSTDQINVIKNTTTNRFEATVDGQLAFAEFHRENGRVTFPHTVVPEPIQRRGIASEIARVALKDARSQGLEVVPHCSFFRSYISRHPEFQDLVKE